MTHADLVALVDRHPETFPAEFSGWLNDNPHIWTGFVEQATSVIDAGYKHYSARTIIEVLRHHSAIAEKGSAWKLNDHCTAYLARLFALVFPEHIGLFDFRSTNHEKAMAA
jgi:hypothetical protein